MHILFGQLHLIELEYPLDSANRVFRLVDILLHLHLAQCVVALQNVAVLRGPGSGLKSQQQSEEDTVGCQDLTGASGVRLTGAGGVRPGRRRAVDSRSRQSPLRCPCRFLWVGTHEQPDRIRKRQISGSSICYSQDDHCKLLSPGSLLLGEGLLRGAP